jgi:hypothetical protein
LKTDEGVIARGERRIHVHPIFSQKADIQAKDGIALPD